MKDSFNQTTTLPTLPRSIGGLPFEQIKNEVLGKKYELSLVFIGDAFSRRLNKIYREKDKPTNVLSFSISKTSGEIFINLRLGDREKKKFDKKLPEFVTYLFIHGLFHLKGMDHGSRMEEVENKILKKYNDPSDRSRNRYRHPSS